MEEKSESSELGSALAEDVGSGVEVIVTAPSQFVPLIWTIGIGLSLILLRGFFIEACPTLADNSVAVAVFIDAITFRLAFLWRKVALALEVLSLATGHGDIVSQWIEAVDPHNLKVFFINTSIECQPYDNLSSVMRGIFRSFAGTAVCPVLRYIYPQTTLYDVSNFVFGWMSFDPDPLSNNCKNSDSDLPVCLSLGVGYIVLEVLVPMILIALLLPLIKSCLKTFYVASKAAVTSAIGLVTSLQKRIKL